MSNCNCGDTHNFHCGKFEEPSNPDNGLPWPYRVKQSCEAPTLPVPECPDEVFSAEYDPDDILAPFKIIAQILDQNCQPVEDESGAPILGALA